MQRNSEKCSEMKRNEEKYFEILNFEFCANLRSHGHAKVLRLHVIYQQDFKFCVIQIICCHVTGAAINEFSN